MKYHYTVGELRWDGMVSDTNGDHCETARHIDEWGNDGWRVASLVQRNDGLMVVLEKPDREAQQAPDYEALRALVRDAATIIRGCAGNGAWVPQGDYSDAGEWLGRASHELGVTL